MTIEEMLARKKELGYSNQTLSDKSGVPVSTIQKVLSGKTTAPRYETINALTRILQAETTYAIPDSDVLMIRESSIGYSAKSGYTIDDYMALPDDERVELIDGVFYDMAAPTSPHQAIAGYIHAQFLAYVTKKKGRCFPLISPTDVQLDCDNKTIVQPDVMIICDRSKIKYLRVYGAPDFVLEVLSPSTRKKDMSIKMHKYINAGVREYWLLDPVDKTVVQYDLENLAIPCIYGPNDKVPVLIWNSECLIDLGELFESIAFMMED